MLADADPDRLRRPRARNRADLTEPDTQPNPVDLLRGGKERPKAARQDRVARWPMDQEVADPISRRSALPAIQSRKEVSGTPHCFRPSMSTLYPSTLAQA